MSTLDLFPSSPQLPAYVQKLIAEHTEHLRHELQVKDAFIRSYYHDIGNYIGNMQTAIDLFNDGHGDNDVLNLLTTSCKLLGEIHENMRLFLKGYPDEVKSGNIEVASWLLPLVGLYRLHAEGRGIKIKQDVDNINGLTIVSDQLKLSRIVINLLGNAIKFTNRGKSIYVKVYTRRTHFYIEVQDEGLGIPADKLTDIFLPYVRLNETDKGLGIGLTICKELVELLQGDISVTSVLSEGTTFTVRLPLSLH